MGPEFEKGDGRLRPSLQQRLPGAEGPPEGCTTAPRHAACGGPLPSSAEGPWLFWHGDAKPQVRPRACPPPARRRCSSHAFSTTGSNAGTGRPAADPSFIGGRRTKGARQGFGVSFVRSFVCCTCTCTHARVRAHAFAHAKARSADLSSNLPKVAARKSCVQLLPPHMGDTVPLLKPHPIYEGILVGTRM